MQAIKEYILGAEFKCNNKTKYKSIAFYYHHVLAILNNVSEKIFLLTKSVGSHCLHLSLTWTGLGRRNWLLSLDSNGENKTPEIGGNPPVKNLGLRQKQLKGSRAKRWILRTT